MFVLRKTHEKRLQEKELIKLFWEKLFFEESEHSSELIKEISKMKEEISKKDKQIEFLKNLLLDVETEAKSIRKMAEQVREDIASMAESMGNPLR